MPLSWWKTKKSASKNNVEQRKEPSNNTNKNAGNCWLPITIGQLQLIVIDIGYLQLNYNYNCNWLMSGPVWWLRGGRSSLVVRAELLFVVVIVPRWRQRVAGASVLHKPGDVQPKVVRLRRQPEVPILGPVRLVVPRDHLDAQPIVACVIKPHLNPWRPLLPYGTIQL